MSWASVALELSLVALLLAALAFGWRLERRLKALRESHAAFVSSVKDLDAAALRADAGLKALRQALDEAHDGLHDRIQKARTLKAELETLLSRADRLPAARTTLDGTARSVGAVVQDRLDAPTARAEPSRPGPSKLGLRQDDAPREPEIAPSRLPRFRRQGAA